MCPRCPALLHTVVLTAIRNVYTLVKLGKITPEPLHAGTGMDGGSKMNPSYKLLRNMIYNLFRSTLQSLELDTTGSGADHLTTKFGCHPLTALPKRPCP